MNKTCLKCKKEKPVDYFNKKLQGYQPFCRECTKEIGKEHYLKNRQVYINKARLWKRKIQFIINFIKSRPCQDCGKTFPSYVMDFDHRDSSVKDFTVSPNIGSLSKKRLKNEIEKCDIVCSNCHRIRTWKRYHSLGTNN